MSKKIYVLSNGKLIDLTWCCCLMDLTSEDFKELIDRAKEDNGDEDDEAA